MRKILKNHHNKFKKGADLVRSKRSAWNGLADKLVRIFDTVVKDAKTVGLFENLYVEDSRKRKSTENMPRFVMLFWGRHPVGTSTLDQNNKLASEGGGTLTFSQSIFGDVICVMYPFKSDLHKRNEEFFILSSPKHPNWYTEGRIVKYIEYFFSYSQASSFVGAPDAIDKLRIGKLVFYDRLKKVNLPQVISSLIKTLLTIIKGMHTGT